MDKKHLFCSRCTKVWLASVPPLSTFNEGTCPECCEEERKENELRVVQLPIESLQDAKIQDQLEKRKCIFSISTCHRIRDWIMFEAAQYRRKGLTERERAIIRSAVQCGCVGTLDDREGKFDIGKAMNAVCRLLETGRIAFPENDRGSKPKNEQAQMSQQFIPPVSLAEVKEWLKDDTIGQNGGDVFIWGLFNEKIAAHNIRSTPGQVVEAVPSIEPADANDDAALERIADAWYDKYWSSSPMMTTRDAVRRAVKAACREYAAAVTAERDRLKVTVAKTEEERDKWACKATQSAQERMSADAINAVVLKLFDVATSNDLCMNRQREMHRLLTTFLESL